MPTFQFFKGGEKLDEFKGADVNKCALATPTARKSTDCM